MSTLDPTHSINSRSIDSEKISSIEVHCPSKSDFRGRIITTISSLKEFLKSTVEKIRNFLNEIINYINKGWEE